MSYSPNVFTISTNDIVVGGEDGEAVLVESNKTSRQEYQSNMQMLWQTMDRLKQIVDGYS